MGSHDASLRWIGSQHDRMCGLVERWANINSGSHHVQGLARMMAAIREEFDGLGGDATEIPLPSYTSISSDGKPIEIPVAAALSIRKHPDAALRIFLGIHMDTVYGPDHPFQRVERKDAHTFQGPGVVDAKGGISVMLIALEALERSKSAGKIGWEVLLNPDEEIGSPSSAKLLIDCAGRNRLGLVFEPALPDGTLVGQRKGSGNFMAVIRGRSAHAGRDFAAGRSAMTAAARFVLQIDSMNREMPGVTVNTGRIEGGGPSNVVADVAVCHFNIRVPATPDMVRVEQRLSEIVTEIGKCDGISIQLHGSFLSPPKTLDEPTLRLLNHIAACGREIGVPIQWNSSGGVSDGNKLAAAGLPVVDTLGPRGGNLHSAEEYLLLDSLTERAKMTALLLLKLADGEIQWE